MDIFNSWIDAGHFRRGGLHDVGFWDICSLKAKLIPSIQFIDGLGKSVFTLSISIASLSFGALLGSTIHPFLPIVAPPRRAVQYTITSLSILTYGAVVVVYFLLSVNYRHEVTASLLFAFPGTLTRYILAVRFNTLLKSLPLGTLLANSIGTALLASFVALQSKANPVSANACSLLQGLMDGYCGCLTTVSTFVVEIYAMPLQKGFRYTLLSWVLGQILFVTILGSPIWSGHANKQMTCLF